MVAPICVHSFSGFYDRGMESKNPMVGLRWVSATVPGPRE